MCSKVCSYLKDLDYVHVSICINFMVQTWLRDTQAEMVSTYRYKINHILFVSVVRLEKCSLEKVIYM